MKRKFRSHLETYLFSSCNSSQLWPECTISTPSLFSSVKDIETCNYAYVFVRAIQKGSIIIITMIHCIYLALSKISQLWTQCTISTPFVLCSVKGMETCNYTYVFIRAIQKRSNYYNYYDIYLALSKMSQLWTQCTISTPFVLCSVKGIETCNYTYVFMYVGIQKSSIIIITMIHGIYLVLSKMSQLWTQCTISTPFVLCSVKGIETCNYAYVFVRAIQKGSIIIITMIHCIYLALSKMSQLWTQCTISTPFVLCSVQGMETCNYAYALYKNVQLL